MRRLFSMLLVLVVSGWSFNSLAAGKNKARLSPSPCLNYASALTKAEQQVAKTLCRGLHLDWKAREDIHNRRCETLRQLYLSSLSGKKPKKPFSPPSIPKGKTLQKRTASFCALKRRYCKIYALNSLQQANNNKNQSCGHNWPLTYSSYNNACLRKPVSATQGAMNYRARLLKECLLLKQKPKKRKVPKSKRLLGCFLDKEKRDLPILMGSGYLPWTCVRACKKNGYQYAGVQFGTWCFCGNRYGKYGERPATECATRCRKNWRYLCGGGWRNHIYRTGLTTARRTAGYLGCFKDQKKRDLPVILGKGYTPRTCKRACKRQQYSYASLQNGGWCMCGNRFGRYGRRPVKECNVRCTKRRAFSCGGAWRNDVYKTDVPLPRTSPGYLGCYLDKDTRDLNTLLGRGYSPLFCKQSCRRKGFAYAGLQNGTWCFCGLQYGRYGRRPEYECNVRCRRDKRYICGGGYRNSVYRIADPMMIRPSKR